MSNKEEGIQVTYEIINGKKIPIYKIPTGMSGSPRVAEYSNDSDSDDDDSTPQINNSLYDEDNIHYNTDKFIDIE